MTMHEIFKEFSFEAAHRLPNVPPGHKCARLHGHSYRVEVHVRGSLDPEKQWVCDFGDIKDAWQPIDAELDHTFLNEVSGLENPTSEALAEWIWARLSQSLAGMCAVIVKETCTSGVVFRGD